MPSFKPATSQGEEEQKAAPEGADVSNEDILNASAKSHNIKSVKITTRNTVDSYTPAALTKRDSLNYNQVRAGFQNQGDSAHNRFKLHELARGVMSVEQEEQVRIEQEIQRRLKILFEKLESQVRETAYKDGFARGLADGKTEVMQQLAPAIAHFEQLIQALEHGARDIVSANEEFILKVVYQIVRKIVMRDVAEDQEFIKRAVSTVIDKVGTRENIKVFVAPHVMADAEKIKADLLASLGQLRNLSIEPDRQIAGPGCRVETEFGTIDASIDAQLANLDEFLKGLV